MSKINHPNLIKAYAVIIANNNAYIAMPLMLYGDLSSVISYKYITGIHDENAIATIMKCCLEAIICLNNNNWFHRDIKCSNILLDKDGSCRIGDYGVSSIIKEGGNNTFVGSLCYMAPEIARKEEYSYKIDIWSLGITALEIANGKPPYKDLSPMDFQIEIESNRIPSLKENEKIKWSDEFKNFLKDCLIKNPNLRPSAAEIMQKHKKFLDKAKNKDYLVESILKGCPNLIQIYPKKLKECDQSFIKQNTQSNANINNDNNIDKNNENNEENKDGIKNKQSCDIAEEMNIDEHIGNENEKKENNFIESLKRKLNKNINDLKGIVGDQDEEEC